MSAGVSHKKKYWLKNFWNKAPDCKILVFHVYIWHTLQRGEFSTWWHIYLMLYIKANRGEVSLRIVSLSRRVLHARIHNTAFNWDIFVEFCSEFLICFDSMEVWIMHIKVLMTLTLLCVTFEHGKGQRAVSYRDWMDYRRRMGIIGGSSTFSCVVSNLSYTCLKIRWFLLTPHAGWHRLDSNLGTMQQH